MKINHGYKVEDDVLFFDYLPQIPVHSPFGHLGEKYGFLMYRLHFTNETLSDIFQYQRIYYECRKKSEFDNNIKLKILHRVLRFSTEIKIILDELLSLYFILNYHKDNKDWPKSIIIDSIGSYLNENNKIKYELFEKHKDLLLTTNNIGNAIKHSFANSEITWLRNDSTIPVLVAYYHKQNDLKNKVEFQYIELPKYIDKLNRFLPDYNLDVKNNYK